MGPPTRHQPKRAVRDKHRQNTQPLSGSKQRHSAKAEPSAIITTHEARRKRGKFHRGAQARVTRALENRISEMDPEVAWSEQRELLGATSKLQPTSPSTSSPETPTPAKGKRGRKKKINGSPEDNKYMDDILLSDDVGADEQEKGGSGSLRRGDRWIPAIEHRSRPTQKPRNVPHQLWMSYCLLDEYIYRQSLTDDEVLTHPLMDDVYSFQADGYEPKPVTPTGFRWNDRRELVPV